MTSITVELPLATAAEQGLAGCAVVANEAAMVAMARTTMSDFHDPKVWEVLVAAAQVPTDMPIDERIAAVAAYAEVEPAELRSWVENRPVYADKSGTLAAQVVAAAEARRRILDHVSALQALGAVGLRRAEVA